MRLINFANQPQEEVPVFMETTTGVVVDGQLGMKTLSSSSVCPRASVGAQISIY